MRSFDEWVADMPIDRSTAPDKCIARSCTRQCDAGRVFCPKCQRIAEDHLARIAEKLGEDGE